MKNKKNLIKVALVLIAALIISTLALTSCSNDSAEPNDENLPAKTPFGSDLAFAHLKFDTKGTFIYDISYDEHQLPVDLLIDSNLSYDYAVIRCVGNEHVTPRTSEITVDYFENSRNDRTYNSVTLYFDVNYEEPAFESEEILLYAQQVQPFVEPVYIYVDIYGHGKKLEEYQEGLSFLAAPQCIAIGDMPGYNYAYYSYIGYLHRNGFMTEKEWDDWMRGKYKSYPNDDNVNSESIEINSTNDEAELQDNLNAPNEENIEIPNTDSNVSP